jgi:cytidylate kinase
LLDAGKKTDDVAAAIETARTLTLADFDEVRLRSRELGEAASLVAAIPAVRTALLDVQRRFAERPEGAVLDGRDIGTVVCPHADVKIFVTAAAETRARRRALELSSRGDSVEYRAILDDIRRRDARDSGRDAAPLKAAADAAILDTTNLDIEGAVAAALALVAIKRAAKPP